MVNEQGQPRNTADIRLSDPPATREPLPMPHGPPEGMPSPNMLMGGGQRPPHPMDRIASMFAVRPRAFGRRMATRPPDLSASALTGEYSGGSQSQATGREPNNNTSGNAARKAKMPGAAGG